MPKIMHKMARTGLEIVIPIFLSPFSTISVKRVHLPTYGLRLHRQPSIFKAFDNHVGNGNF
jgi:hypothetical protein